jgi:hypothetical protein
MEDALAVVGNWIGLLKAAKFAVAEVNRDCEERVATGSAQAADEFRHDLDTVFETLSALIVGLEEQAEVLEDELEDD